MKKISFYFFFYAFLASFFAACVSDDEEKWNAAEVCPESKRGSFTDDRDGQVYKYTTIGNQVWMSENLRYEAENNRCLSEYIDNNSHKFENFSKKHGCYYSTNGGGSDWKEVDGKFLNSLCPEGWVLPNEDDWNELIKNMENEKLHSDECRMSILNAGAYISDSYQIAFFSTEAVFMTSSVDSEGLLKTVKVGDDFSFFNSFPKMSVRCLKD